jgi:hypothetical protein
MRMLMLRGIVMMRWLMGDFILSLNILLNVLQLGTLASFSQNWRLSGYSFSKAFVQRYHGSNSCFLSTQLLFFLANCSCPCPINMYFYACCSDTKNAFFNRMRSVSLKYTLLCFCT